MALELKQQLRLRQQLVMTPQLQQAIKLLQLNRLELVLAVQQELEENPVLEEVEGEDETPEISPEEAEVAAVDEPAAAASEESAEAPEPGDEPDATDAEKVADLDWENYIDAFPQTTIREARDDDDRPSLEATLTRRPTLIEHLTWQLQLLSFPFDEDVVTRFIVGNIDERGYLEASLDEIARQSGMSMELVERALTRVQQLDPAGVAARDLRECLTIQARTLAIEDPVVLRILDECLDRLIKRDFRGVARELGVSVERVSEAAETIGKLEPRPGRAFGGDEPIYIIPDIYVYKVGDDLHIVLNDDGLPRLRINSLYRDVLARGKEVPQDTRTYVHEKVRSALWLIKSIHQRQRTIYKVMLSLTKYQRDFFEKGITHLRPLNLRDVADDIEMHESTVSRVTTNKYVHCPQGVFELKYFFNSSISRVVGEAVASSTVKDRIGHLIRNEDPRRPLSDQRIAEMLRVANIDIARRTVTKYRESLNILSSTKRRQVG
ncbi:MAG: RNA polymerase factor sigma-54 [Myxococcota bacterium]